MISHVKPAMDSGKLENDNKSVSVLDAMRLKAERGTPRYCPPGIHESYSKIRNKEIFLLIQLFFPRV